MTGTTADSASTAGGPGPVYAIRDVDAVFPGLGRIERVWTVVTRGDRIGPCGPSHLIETPQDAITIDGRGRFLLPGFTDMHVHVGLLTQLEAPETPAHEAALAEVETELMLYLAHGVTTVRDMASTALHRELEARIASGELAGPRIVPTSPIIDGVPPVWSFSPTVSSPDEAWATARRFKAEGYGALKIYNHVDRRSYAALIEAGRELGMGVVGHVPFDVGITGALAARQHSIEHFRGYDVAPGSDPRGSSWVERAAGWLAQDEDDLKRLADLTEAAGTWNCPTFTVIEAGIAMAAQRPEDGPDMALAPDGLRGWTAREAASGRYTASAADTLRRGLPVQHALLRLLSGGSNRLLIGTDAGYPGIVPGRSLHDELAQFVAAGLGPFEALAICCEQGPRFLGDGDRGRIAEGAVADLVLLDADPTRDITNSRRIAGVMARGRWFPTTDIAKRASRTAATI